MSALRVASIALLASCAATACGPVEPPPSDAATDSVSLDASPYDAAIDGSTHDRVAIGDGGSGEIPTIADPLFVRAITYNSTMVPLGVVTALAENSTTTVFFGSLGMRLFVSGALTASSDESTSWRSAATVPAGIGAGSWIVAADGMGRVHRLRPDHQLEPVSDRYGLAGQSVRAIASGGMMFVGFATDTGLAIADGMNVRRFMEGPFTTFAAGSGQFAGVGMDRVKALDAMTGRLRTFNLPGASAVAVDSAGKLVVAAGDVLWAEDTDGALTAVFRAPSTIRSLARSGSRLWFLSGRELGTFAMGRVAMTRSMAVPMSATGLVASPSGDVWVLTNGAPLRFAVDTGMQTPEALWQATMQPIYVAVCARCHAPERILPDLSTYAGWNANRMKIENSVVMQGEPPMPPDGSMTSEQRMAVARWLMMR